MSICFNGDNDTAPGPRYILATVYSALFLAVARFVVILSFYLVDRRSKQLAQRGISGGLSSYLLLPVSYHFLWAFVFCCVGIAVVQVIFPGITFHPLTIATEEAVEHFFAESLLFYFLQKGASHYDLRRARIWGCGFALLAFGFSFAAASYESKDKHTTSFILSMTLIMITGYVYAASYAYSDLFRPSMKQYALHMTIVHVIIYGIDVIAFLVHNDMCGVVVVYIFLKGLVVPCIYIRALVVESRVRNPTYLHFEIN
jgi:hypothetical protein